MGPNMASTNKRRLVEQLPVVLQTDTNRKFFAATVDHLFQPGNAETLSGYIGQKPPYYDPTRDFYIAEPTVARQAYQLEAAMVSTDESGAVTRALTYEDLIGYLSTFGADTSNHERLFETEYYSWAPPIDIDKLLNYRNYYWFGDLAGQGLLPSLSIAAPFAAYIGDGVRTRFTLPPTISGLTAAEETPVGTVDRNVVETSRDDDDLVFVAPPPAGSIVLTYRYGDLTRVIEGKTTFSLSGFDMAGIITSEFADGTTTRFEMPPALPGLPVSATLLVDGVVVDSYVDDGQLVATTVPPVGAAVVALRHQFFLPFILTSSFITGRSAPALSSGMRVRLLDAYGLTFGWDNGPWDLMGFDVSGFDTRGDRFYYVEGVGRGIRLVPQALMGWGVAAQHTTVDRSSRDRNPWSLRNHWVHKDTFAWSGRSFPDRQARRPIIEFERDLWLHNYGYRRIPDVGQILTDPRGVIRFKEWDETGFDLFAWDEPSPNYIPIEQLNGQLLAGLFLAPGQPLTPGVRLLVAQATSSAPILNNRVYRIETDGEGAERRVVLVPEIDVIEAGTIATISITPGVEYWFDGTSWRQAQAWVAGAAPLFRLTDLSGTALDDGVTYPGSDFVGNRIFGFAPGTSSDAILGQSIRRDSQGRIMFEADAATRRTSWRDGEVGGLYFHVFQDENGARPGTMWRPASGTTSQPVDADGVYPIAPNLQANPDNEEVSFLTRGDFFSHFNTIIASQDNFSGDSYGNNNWRDTARRLSRGDRILQHRAPLLKTMLLASDENFDLPTAIRYAEQEYSRFRAKFVVRTDDLVRRGVITPEMTAAEAVETTLTALKTEKSSEFPFALSPLGGGQFFIPPTPASIGVAPCMEPGAVTIDGILHIRGHDGSLTPSFGDYRDGVLLVLEERIWNNLPDRIRTAERPAFDLDRWVNGRFTSLPNSYDASSLKALLRAPFEKWCQLNGFDYKTNNGYASNDPWTWNYRDAPDAFGEPIPFGYWRGLYRFFFDTDRPHEEPWAMLGFATKPSWWDVEYGAAPYTRGNTKLWDDLEAGRIRGGARQGIDDRYVRAGLSRVIPVDDGGDLLDPVSAGLVARAPDISAASRNWVYGDFAPVEALWGTSPAQSFYTSIAAFLMKPARFVEQGWATVDNGYAGGQWLDLNRGNRPRHADLSVHGEDDATVIGIQQWVVDYMISRGQTADLLGDAIRGLDVRLAHKVAGFTTADGLRVTADNFGLLPAEDVRVALYRSPIVRKETYSGVIVEWAGSGWRVIGYDARDPTFSIIPGDINGPRGVITLADQPEPVINEWRPSTFFPVNIVVAYDGSTYRCARSHTSGTDFEPIYWTAEPTAARRAPRVVKYLRGNGDVERVPYGTIFATQQEVADFLLSHERWLVSRGWLFDVVDGESQETRNWSQSVREFLAWSQIGWAPGAFIALSPGAEELRFSTPRGTILNVETQQEGFFSLVDRGANPIDRRDSVVTRIDGDISMVARNAGIFGARLGVAEYEHILLFSNRTIFDDVIYAPLFNLRQPRLRILGKRTQDWTGRLDAPGFVLVDGEIVPNFEKTADDIRYAFDVEKADRADLRDHARHLIGYQSREYLSNLLLSETEQFEFYQGMIQQKGTRGVFERLLRSQQITENRDLRFLEEWAVRVGRFGGRPGPRAAFRLQETEVRREPQFVRLGSTTPGAPADWIEMPTTDERWIERPRGYAMFPLLQEMAPEALPTAGYARLGETQHTAFTVDDVAALFRANTTTFPVGERVWVFNYGPQRSWTVLRSEALGTTITLTSGEDDNAVIGLRVTLGAPHGLTSIHVGSLVVLEGDAFADLSGVYAITAVGADWVEIDAEADSQTITAPDALAVRFLRPIRFSTRSSLITSGLSFAQGETVYVDDFEDGKGWAYVARNGFNWDELRREPKRIDARSVSQAMIYDLRTEVGTTRLTPTPPLLDRINIIDPVSGMISGAAERELTYKLDHDPARYDSSPYGGDEWGADQVGELWWDLSTVRFIDPLTDVLDASNTRTVAEVEYRVRNWSHVAPGTHVDVYEWTASSVPPNRFDGVVYGGDTARYIEQTVFDPVVGRNATTYYFWVRAPQTTPPRPDRRLSARGVASLIENPLSLDLPWMAPVTSDGLVVGGVSSYLNNDSTLLKIDVRPATDAATHDEWMLLRPNDERSLPPAWLWDKLRDSLTGFDERQRPIPSPLLGTTQRTGIRPGQGMFVVDSSDGPRRGLLDARESFVGIVNAVLARTSVVTERPAGVASLTRSSPLNEFLLWTQADGDFYVEPTPPSSEYDYVVYGPEERDALLMRPNVVAALLGGQRLRVLVDGLARPTPQWSIWEASPEVATARHDPFDPNALVAAAQEVFTLAKSYDRVVATSAERDALIPTAESGERVLVTEGDRWTIWRFNGTEFDLIRAETFRTEDFFGESDWYAAGYSPASPPVVRYSDMLARDQAEGATPTSTFVRLDNDGSGRWVWTVFAETTQTLSFLYVGGDQTFDIGLTRPSGLVIRVAGRTLSETEYTLADFEITISSTIPVGARVQIEITQGLWTTVARERGTLALSPAFFDAERETVSLTGDFANRDGSWEMRAIVDTLRTGGLLTDLELNEVFFSMLHFIHVQQDEVDWAFKTSFLSVAGYDEVLEQTPVTTADITNNLLAYIDEVKPYRVKTRSFLRALSTNADTALVRVTEPERKTKLKMRFDRLSTASLWDYGAWDLNAWDAADPGDPGNHAVDRVSAYYNPKPGMREKSIPDLFKLGTDLLDGGTLDPLPDYSIAYDGNGTADSTLLDGSAREGKPEERIELAHDDGLVMVIRAKGTPGAPWHEVTTLSAVDTLRLSNVAQTASAVAVYIDGKRGFEGIDYTVDHIAGTVTPLIGGSRMLAHAIGPSGTVNARYFYQYRGGAATFTLDDTAEQELLDVVVNGQRLPDGAFSLSGNTLTLSTVPALDTDVVITQFRTVASASARVNVDVLTYRSDQTWTLPNRDAITAPEHAGTIVELDGLRLTPPPTYYATLSANKFWVDTEFEPDTITRIDIWVNGALDTRPVLRGSFASADAARAAVDASNNTSGFAVFGPSIVAGSSTPVAAQIIVAIHERHQYAVDNGTLRVFPAMTAEAKLHVTTFTNADLVQPVVLVFEQATDGIYDLPFPTDTDQVWVTVNGLRLSPSEYNLLNRVVGFDEEAWDESGFDSDAPRQLLSLANPSPGETVVVSMFLNEAAREPMAWRIATGSHANARMVPLHPVIPQDLAEWVPGTVYAAGDLVAVDRRVYRADVAHVSDAVFDEGPWTLVGAKPSGFPNSDYDVEAWDTFGWDIPVDDVPFLALNRFDDQWERVATPVRARLALAAPLTPSTATISVDLWADTQRSDKLRDGVAISLPDTTNGIPGVIWVAGERIEYFSLAINGDTATLGQLRRATKGTSLSESLPIGTPVYDGTLLFSPDVPVSALAGDRRAEPVRTLLAAA